MPNDDFLSAKTQLATLDSFAQNVEANLKLPPFTIPQDPVRAAGIDPDLWCGLGLVGVWAALDAYGERTRPDKGSSFMQRFSGEVDAAQGRILNELDDLRALFAHNFGGVADAKYLSYPRRHFLKMGKSYTLACGLTFKGEPKERVKLGFRELAHYIREAGDILNHVGA